MGRHEIGDDQYIVTHCHVLKFQQSSTRCSYGGSNIIAVYLRLEIQERLQTYDPSVELQVSVLPLLTILLSYSNRDSSIRDLNLRRLNER